MADPHPFQVQKCSQNLMKNISCLSFAHWSIIDNMTEKLSVRAIFHDNVDFVVFFDYLVNLSDILVK